MELKKNMTTVGNLENNNRHIGNDINFIQRNNETNKVT